MRNPLVSICIISYNSLATIVETLDSAAAQTYSNIELVVSDDGSRDWTVDIVRQWAERNGGRFTDIKIITVEKNSGITPNCNRAWRASRGEWVKFIAADDILKPGFIETNIDYARRHPRDRILFSPLELFGGGKWQHQWENRWVDMLKLFASLETAREQYKTLLRDNFAPAPTSFIRRDVLEELGGFDEDILFIEDLPFWLRATRRGIKLTLIECEPLVLYRASDTSVQFANPRFDLAYLLFMSKYIIFNPLYWVFRGGIDQINIDKRFSKVCRNFIFLGSIPHRVIKKLTNLKKI